MMRWMCLFGMLLMGCELVPKDTPPPVPQELPSPARAVLELYMHQDGKTNCVDGARSPWQAYQCCPEGFSHVGFSVPAATEYPDGEDDVDRRLYRHVVCLQDAQ